MSRFRTIGLNDSKSELSVCLSLESLTPSRFFAQAICAKRGEYPRSFLVVRSDVSYTQR